MIENLEEIKAQLNIENVLQEIGYDKSNPQYSGKEVRDYCPAHGGDNQRSLCINVQTKACKCFTCGFEGDLIGLYMKSKNVDFADAVKTLAPIAVKYSASVKTDMPQIERTPRKVLDSSSSSGDHPYLKLKKVDACADLYYGKDSRGNPSIVVPFWSADGILETVQFVHSNGKYFLSGYSYIGAFFSTSDSFNDGDIVYLAEGLATMLTIWMALNKSAHTVSFGSANNLVHVAKALKSKYPNIKLVICLDNNEAALTQVEKLKDMSNFSYRLPSFNGMTSFDSSKPLADFNDIISKCNQPLSVVTDQLNKALSFSDLPIPINKTGNDAATEVVKNDIIQSSFNSEFQEDLLSYLLNRQTLVEVMQDGFNPSNFGPHLFTGYNRLAIDGIIKAWEQDVPVSIAQVSINSGNSSSEFYKALNHIKLRSTITPQQVPDRLKQLNQQHAQERLNTIISQAQHSNLSLEEKCDILRKGADIVHGTSVTILPQTYHLPQIIDNIKNPKYKPLATGIKSLDRLIGGGFIKEELGILTGGAGAGKSAFALQVTDSVAKKGGIVIYISIEIGENKLTERSLKRLEYKHGSYENGLAEYQSFAENIYLVKGRHNMQVAEIRGMVLNVAQQRKDKDILLIIDPFQRLGTGNERVDSNETTKVNELCSQIKEMGTDLKIPILALSDTVKAHKDNKTGEGLSRGSYMADHTGDYMIHLRTSRIAIKAIYGEKPDAKEIEDDPFIGKIETKLNRAEYTDPKGRYALKYDWDKYAALVTSKVRDNCKFSPLFIYKPNLHLFEDTELWEDIF